MNANEIKKLIDGRTIELDSHILYLQFNAADNTIEAGAICNAGIMAEYAIEYDFAESIDNNLQKLFNLIMEA